MGGVRYVDPWKAFYKEMACDDNDDDDDGIGGGGEKHTLEE